MNDTQINNTPPNRVFSIGQVFIRGILVLLPLFVSIYSIIWMGQTIDRIFAKILNTISPQYVLPSGLGLIIGLAIIFVIGFTSEFFIAKYINGVLQRLMSRIPLVSTIFNSLKSLADYLNPQNQTARGKTVIVHFPSKEDSPNKMKLIGFMTQQRVGDMPAKVSQALGDAEQVAVYLPMSYQVGGYTVFVKRSQIEEVDVSFEQAMQGTLTSWMQIKN